MRKYTLEFMSGSQQVVEAETYSTVGEFIDFVKSDPDDGMFSLTVLRVRANDVSMIQLQD